MVNRMKKKIVALCSVMIVLSICIAMFGMNGATQTDVTTATAKIYRAQKAETTNALSGIVGDVIGGLNSDSSSDKIDGVIGSIEGVSGDIDSALDNFGDIGDSLGSLGGVGDAFGGIVDAFGGIGDSLSGALGGLSGIGSGSVVKTTASVSTTSADIGLIIPVPAATQTASDTQAASTTEESKTAGETVDYAATSNPYTKPTSTFVAGDEDETIKWLQWIFVYSGYGLKDDGITGVLDEDTVAVIKKLQKEKELTVDGNITEDVIKAAEILFYQSILGDGASAIEVSSQATTGVNVSYESVSSDDGNSVSVILLIVILVIIWVLAIGGIVLLFVLKKKKTNSQKAEQTKSEGKNDASNTEEKETLSSIADLFKEAEENNK